MTRPPRRQPIHHEAMTSAERAHRYRQARKRRQVLALRDPSTAPLVSLFDELRDSVRLGDVEAVKGLAAEMVRRAQQVRDASRKRKSPASGSRS